MNSSIFSADNGPWANMGSEVSPRPTATVYEEGQLLTSKCLIREDALNKGNQGV